MTSTRSLLLIGSALVVLSLIGGGLVVRVGAAESSYRQAVLFAEILSQVMDNYVDPVEADGLLEGAYEGMLGGMDPNGAYLTPAELAEWKKPRDTEGVGAGISVLRSRRTLQVVAVETPSAALDAGIRVGDHIRSIDGELVRDLSLAQARRLIEGPPGTTVVIELLHPDDAFRRDKVELTRRERRERRYGLNVRDGIALLRVHDLREIPLDALREELDDVSSRGVDRLLIDLRNVAEGRPADAVELASLFAGRCMLRLRDRAGRLLETLEGSSSGPGWQGGLAVLVNGATAGGAEALVAVLRQGGEVRVYGETTYGLGAETKLYELDNGAGLLVSAASWETDDGQGWNGKGIDPDEIVRGEGGNIDETATDQLERVLELLRSPAEPERQAA